MQALYAGVDLGGTTVTCALADAAGNMVHLKTIPTESHAGPPAVLQRIASLVLELAEPSGSPPQAVGMGVPGLVDIHSGVTKFLPNLPTHWRDVEAGSILAERIGAPVRLLNDVRTATLGELTYGHGAQFNTMAFFSLGTGIGGGIAIDGKLRLGPLGAAGELGHQTIVPDGPLCGCGNRGCLETLASGPALIAEGIRLMKSGLAPHLHEIVEGDAGRVSPKEIGAAARQGDEAVSDAIRRAAGYLGIGVANIVTILHPELVVFGGGVAQMDLLVETVQEVVRDRVRMIPVDDFRIERSMLGDRAGVLGAVALAAHGVKED
ncbi:MAG: ROK family protein [Pirellulaceae bacterium]